MNNILGGTRDPMEARKILIEMQTIGKSLIANSIEIGNPLRSLIPLGLTLLEGHDLFNILLEFDTSEKILTIFDAGENSGPNIYTRTRFMRDLCSASQYVIFNMSTIEKVKATNKDRLDNYVHISEDEWLSNLSRSLVTSNSKALTEVARLLSDIFDALLSISALIGKKQARDESEVWGEVSRQIQHIRDHFDYADDYLLDLLEPAKD